MIEAADAKPPGKQARRDGHATANAARCCPERYILRGCFPAPSPRQTLRGDGQRPTTRMAATRSQTKLIAIGLSTPRSGSPWLRATPRENYAFRCWGRGSRPTTSGASWNFSLLTAQPTIQRPAAHPDIEGTVADAVGADHGQHQQQRNEEGIVRDPQQAHTQTPTIGIFSASSDITMQRPV